MAGNRLRAQSCLFSCRLLLSSLSGVCLFLQVDSEEPVFEAVINWVKHSKKDREASLPELLQYVRMPLLTPRYITDVIDTEVWAEAKPDVDDEMKSLSFCNGSLIPNKQC